jgi:hypothetical protein
MIWEIILECPKAPYLDRDALGFTHTALAYERSPFVEVRA